MKIYSFVFGLCLLLLTACSKEEDTPSNSVDVVLIVSDFSTSIAENPNNDQLIGSVSAETNEGTLEYSIISQNPEGAFSINPETGELRVANPVFFDFETHPEIVGVVEAKNGQLTENMNVNIELTDVFEGECNPDGAKTESLFSMINTGSNFWNYGSLTIHEFTFSFTGDKVICRVGYKGDDNGIYNIKFEDSNGNILYAGDHQFSNSTLNYVDIEPIQIIAGEEYTVTRTKTTGSIEGMVFDNVPLPIGLSYMIIHSSKFYGDGFELYDVGVPYIAFGLAE